MYYSATLNAFFPVELKAAYLAAAAWPADAKLVEKAIFEEFALQSPPPGQCRIAGPNGLPVWVGGHSDESLMDANQARQWRDGEIARVAWLRDRHRDEMELGLQPTLSTNQFLDLLRYIQFLRDWPESDGFPVAGLPLAPRFSSEK